MPTRRAILSGLAASALLPRWVHAAGTVAARDEWDLEIARTRRPVAGRTGKLITVNGAYPGPLVRLRQGRQAVLRVKNTLDGWSSIHWHGLLLPPEMDGVPGVSFAGIPPGETFEYRFDVRQSGTYWYHSHSGMQEQLGLAGPLVIDGDDELEPFDRELVLVLTDWTPMDPMRVMAVLKKQAAYFNYQRRSIFDALAGRQGMSLRQSLAWSRMRMDPTDISDVTGATYDYLCNGHSSAENWTGLFEPGERVRLRIINAGAMTYFDLRIPGLPMKVVAADGIEVDPVEVDELRIAVAETYDVVVVPGDRAYTVFAETMDRSGSVRATLAPQPGMQAEVPMRRARPLLTMADMGMDMGAMDMGAMDMGGTEMGGMDHGGMDMGAMDHGAMDESTMDHGGMSHAAAPLPLVVPADLHLADYPTRSRAKGIEPADLDSLGPVPAHGPGGHGPLNPMVATKPRRRLAERLVGQEDAPWRVLCYADLKARAARPDPGPVTRELELHLTGHMERYSWSFDGKKFSEAPYIDLAYGERLRITYVNDTMMTHPLHLHGMFVELDNGRGDRLPLKHTVSVAPAERISVLLTADEVGDWAFHCHLLFHMDMGMFRVVRVRPDSVARRSP